MTSYTFGIDVGGTFTDVVCQDGDRLRTVKVPSVPGDQARGVLNGISETARQLDISTREMLSNTEIIVHGTTVGTNTMLEFNGAHTFMLTTRGVRDIIDIRRNYKEAAFDLRLPAPVPIVPRRRRIPITQRMNYQGEVVTPLGEEEVRSAARRLGDEGAEAVAVCFLFSFLNPAHELRVQEIFNEELPDLRVSLSHRVLPRIREFERFSTTAVDAYTAPMLGRYLSKLEIELREEGFEGDLLIMRNNGGVADVERAREMGVDLLFSGPAAGVVAAAHIGATSGINDLITMDMGGTSCDVCLIQDAKPSVGTETWISRYRVAVPVIDVNTVGAGGGSIAWVDDGGALRIGPESAGADPGPAAYANGGTRPTVTDADVVLGYVNPEAFLGGTMPLDVEAAREAIRSHVAEPLGMSVEEAAQAVFRIVNHNMANAVSVVSLAKGYDPRDFALMAFGGAGPIHASALVGELGIRKVIVPRTYAPVLCAVGDVTSDIRETLLTSYYARGSKVDLVDLSAKVRAMIAAADDEVGEKARELPRSVTRAVEMRYKGQTHEVVVPLAGDPDEGVTAEDWATTIDDFHRLHEENFSFNRPGVETEVIGLQIERWAERPKAELTSPAAATTEDMLSARKVFLPDAETYVDVRAAHGAGLAPGFEADGPMIIDEDHTCVLVLEGQRVRLTPENSYVIEVVT